MQIVFVAEIKKFAKMGEKTGWTYIEFSEQQAQQIKPNTKTSFRVKGLLDKLEIKQTALLPMGDGSFILPINAQHRKATRKREGHSLEVSLMFDDSPLEQSDDLLMCLEEEPKAWEYFNSLPPSHQRYYSKWVEDAKTIETKTKRIAMCIQGMAMGMDYGQTIRYFRDKNK